MVPTEDQPHQVAQFGNESLHVFEEAQVLEDFEHEEDAIGSFHELREHLERLLAERRHEPLDDADVVIQLFELICLLKPHSELSLVTIHLDR